MLLIVSFPAVKVLLQSGGFTSHDLTHHVIRQISMDKILSEGQFPPRWSGELNGGFGYPVFLFNYPLPSMLGEVFHKLGLNFVDSVKSVLFTSMIISSLGMYLFLKELLGSRLAAFLGAVFFLYAPLRFLNVYVSAAVGSALALGIIPFVFWAIIRLLKTGSGIYLLLGSLFLAALITAHNVTALIFAPVVIIFSFVCSRLGSDKNASTSYFRNLGAIFLLGLGLSAWFWLPATLEKQFIIFDQIYQDFYKSQFLNVWQLLRSPWGYGLSHPQNPEPGDMSYQLGLIHILMMVLLIISLYFIRKIKEFRIIGALTVLTFVISVFLMLKPSIFLWQNLPFLSLVQFPQRFQSISVFAASIAAALLVKYLPFKRIIFLTLVILVIYANRNHWRINEVFDPEEQYYLNLQTTTTSYGEHLPKWGRIAPQGSLSKLQFIEGGGEIKIISDQSAKVVAYIEATISSKLRFNQFYFPGWEIKIDGKPAEFNYLIDGESYGLQVFDIDRGKHQMAAEFKNTPVRNIADGISLASVIIWLIIICRLLILK